MLDWLEATRMSVFIRESAWAFPAAETVHLLGLTLTVGTISIVDLRLLGLASMDRPITQICREVLPATWASFVVAVLGGLLLFISHPGDYLANGAFRMKLLLVALAGVNMLVFQLMTYRGVSEWDLAPKPPLSARIAGAVSLICWIGAVLCGRWISFL